VNLTLYELVALTRDIPEHTLRAGDVATLVDFADPPEPGAERGCVLEVFNAVGETLAVVIVPESAVQALRSDQIPSVRSLSTT
jgi:hypothetical protein